MQNSPVLSVNIHLESPVIVIPFLPTGDPGSECWIMNLGNLDVKTNESILDASIKAEDKIFDIYDINLSQIKLQYYPSYYLFEAKISNKPKEILDEIQDKIKLLNRPLQSYDVICDFNINVQISLLKAAVAQIMADKAATYVKANIPGITLQLKQEIYHRLLKMGGCFAIPEKEEEELEAVQLDRIQLLKTCKKAGEIWKRGDTVHNWKKYSGVLSGAYLYLFANPRDSLPEAYIYVRDSVVTPVDAESLGMKNAFMVFHFI